jgi:NTP pyrophosphatase (non-canonical NTP hydrolase)
MSEHFNELTPAEAERLACLAEECGEVVQAVGIILRHGFESRNPKGSDDGDPTNRETLERECGDILATLDLLGAARDINTEAMESARTKKHQSRKAYFHHQDHHRIKR